MLYLKRLLAWLATFVPHTCDSCKIQKCKRFYKSLHLTTYPEKGKMVCDACLERQFMKFAWELELCITYGLSLIEINRKDNKEIATVFASPDYKAMMEAYDLIHKALRKGITVERLVDYLKQAVRVFKELDRIAKLGGFRLQLFPDAHA